jgi:hypothetical protein
MRLWDSPGFHWFWLGVIIGGAITFAILVIAGFHWGVT